MFHVVRFDDEGETLTLLKSFHCEDVADDYCYAMGHEYPHAHVDLFTEEEYQQALTIDQQSKMENIYNQEIKQMETEWLQLVCQH